MLYLKYNKRLNKKISCYHKKIGQQNIHASKIVTLRANFITQVK